MSWQQDDDQPRPWETPQEPQWQQQPQWGQGYEARPHTSGMAIASLVTSIVGTIFCQIVALVGLVLGVVALTQINGSNGMETGRGLAIAGIVIGALGIAFFVVILALGFGGLSINR